MRRAHTKSRRGCRDCKRRKIKCDENRPQCDNCTGRQIHCSFAEQSHSVSVAASRVPIQRNTNAVSGVLARAIQPSPTTTAVRLAVDPSAGPSSSAQRLLDLRLFHHYTSRMADIPFEDCVIKEVFTAVIPSLALQHAPILDAHLAISALSLSVQCPNDGAFGRATYEYICSATRQLQNLLVGGVGPDNAEMACVTSILIALHSAMSCRAAVGIDRGETISLRWVQPFQGVGAMLSATWPWIQDSKVVRMFVRSTSWPPRYQLSLNSPFAFLLEGVDDACISTRRAYEYALGYAEYALNNPRQRYLPLFLASVPRQFAYLVAALDSRSLVILGLHFSMAQGLDRDFLLESSAYSELHSIISLLPEDWRLKLDRARALVAARTHGSSVAVDIRNVDKESPEALYF